MSFVDFLLRVSLCLESKNQMVWYYTALSLKSTKQRYIYYLAKTLVLNAHLLGWSLVQHIKAHKLRIPVTATQLTFLGMAITYMKQYPNGRWAFIRE